MQGGRRKRAPGWLLRDPSPDSATRLFCLPYAGCGASMYHRWPRFLDDLEICPVQFPGRENRVADALPRSYEELAASFVAQMRPHLDRPFAFFGHCGVASAAYEMTLELARQGELTPACLFVSSAKAPQDGPYGRFLTMGREERAGEMAAIIARMGGASLPELVDLAVEVLEADLAASVAYTVPAPTRLPCRAVAIGWDADPDVPPEHMTGWRECAETEFVVLRGDHFSFLEPDEELRNLLRTNTSG